MTPGPTTFYQCPTCEKMLRRSSFSSANTFGGILYSDGKGEYPYLPDFPRISICRKCRTIFWLELNKIKTVSKLDMAEVSPEWERADWADFLTIDQYFFALSGGMADNKEDEKYIRERIWWGYNDRYREGIDIFESVDDGLRWLKNCNKLINLYDQSDTTQRLQTAELHRHLGEFEKAEEIIKSVKAVDLEEVKAKMIEACGRKDRKVMRII